MQVQVSVISAAVRRVLQKCICLASYRVVITSELLHTMLEQFQPKNGSLGSLHTIIN